MIISPLYNNVSKKKELWQSFSEDNKCNFRHFVTKSRDTNKLLMEYTYNGINISFEESDGKPLICSFNVRVSSKFTLEISKSSLINKIFRIFRKNNNKHTFLLKNNVRSSNTLIKNTIIKDSIFLDLLNNSDFSGLYAYTKKDILEARVTSSYFVDNYKKIKDIYLVVNSLIDKIIKTNDKI